jgi:hypothetical protein
MTQSACKFCGTKGKTVDAKAIDKSLEGMQVCAENTGCQVTYKHKKEEPTAK